MLLFINDIEFIDRLYLVCPLNTRNHECEREHCKIIRMNPEGYAAWCPAYLKYIQNFSELNQEQSDMEMKKLVETKLTWRDYENMDHAIRNYSFWRFGKTNDCRF